MENQTQNRIPQLVFNGSITCETPVSFALHNVKARSGEKVIPQPMMRTADGDRLYINAPAIRSAFRHAATEHVQEILDRLMHMDDYFTLALGGIKDAKPDAKSAKNGKASAEDFDDGDTAKKAEEDVDVGYLLKYRFAKEKNPLLMLFGSMDVPGLVECAHAIAQKDMGPITMGSVRANDFRRNPDIVNMLDPTAIDAFIERQSMAAQRSQSKKSATELDRQIKAAKAAGNVDLAAELSEQKVRADSGKSGAVQLQQLLQYQAIPAGTVMSHSMRLRRATELEIALFVQAIARWALDPVVGGKRAHGLGHVSGQWNVRARLPGELSYTEFGALQFNADMGLIATGRISEYLDVEKVAAPIRDGKLDFSYASLARLA